MASYVFNEYLSLDYTDRPYGYAFNEYLSLDYTDRPYGYAFNEYLPVDYSIPPNNAVEAICRSSSDAVPSQESSYGDVLSTSSVPSEMTAVTDAGYASNKYPSLHYGDHPHDHMKAVSNTLSHAILSPYSGTMPTFSIPLGQTETTAESHSGYAFNEYLPLDYSSYPGNTLEAICNSSSSAVPSLCDALSMSPMPSDQNETAAVTDSGYVFNKYHSHNSMEATSPYLDLWHVFP